MNGYVFVFISVFVLCVYKFNQVIIIMCLNKGQCTDFINKLSEFREFRNGNELNPCVIVSDKTENDVQCKLFNLKQKEGQTAH